MITNEQMFQTKVARLLRKHYGLSVDNAAAATEGIIMLLDEQCSIFTLENVLEYLYMAVSSKGQNITDEGWLKAAETMKQGYLHLKRLRENNVEQT